MNDPLALYPVADSVYATIKRNAERDVGAPVACRPGCNACCHVAVSASYAEAMAITATRNGMAAVKERAGPALVLLRRKPTPENNEYSRAWLPCMFLNDSGGCSVYPVRPLMCRGFFAFDAQKCADRTFPGHTIVNTKDTSIRFQGMLTQRDDTALVGPLPVMVHIARIQRTQGVQRARREARRWHVDTPERLAKRWKGW